MHCTSTNKYLLRNEWITNLRVVDLSVRASYNRSSRLLTFDCNFCLGFLCCWRCVHVTWVHTQHFTCLFIIQGSKVQHILLCKTHLLYTLSKSNKLKEVMTLIIESAAKKYSWPTQELERYSNTASVRSCFKNELIVQLIFLYCKSSLKVNRRSMRSNK